MYRGVRILIKAEFRDETGDYFDPDKVQCCVQTVDAGVSTKTDYTYGIAGGIIYRGGQVRGRDSVSIARDDVGRYHVALVANFDSLQAAWTSPSGDEEGYAFTSQTFDKRPLENAGLT